MKHRGCSIPVNGIEIVQGMLWLRGWEVGNEQCMRVGWIGLPAKNQKLSHWGSVSVNETQGVFDFD